MNKTIGGTLPLPFSAILGCLGYCLMLITNHFILRDPTAVVSSLGLLQHETLLVRLSLDVAFICGLLGIGVYSLLKKREIQIFYLVIAQTIVACIISIDSLLCLFCTFFFPEMLLSVLCLSLGLFAALGLIIWVSFLGQTPEGNAWFSIIISLFISAFAYVFMLFAAIVLPAIVVVVFLCLASLAITWWFLVRFCQHDREDKEGHHPAIQLKQAVRDNLSAVLCTAGLGFALSASSMISLAGETDATIDLTFATGILFAAIVFLTFACMNKDAVDIRIVYQVAFPFIAFFFLLTPFLNDAFRIAFLLISSMVGTMGATLLSLISFRARRLYGAPLMGIFGSFLGVAHVFYLAGWASSLEGASHGNGVFWYAVSTLLFVYIFAAVLMLSRTRFSKSNSGSTVLFIQSEQQLQDSCDSLAVEHDLSKREKEIMQLLVLGNSVEDIADQLVISVNTVRTHNKNLYKKLGIHTKSELVRLASRNVSERSIRA